MALRNTFPSQLVVGEGLWPWASSSDHEMIHVEPCLLGRWSSREPTVERQLHGAPSQHVATAESEARPVASQLAIEPKHLAGITVTVTPPARHPIRLSGHGGVVRAEPRRPSMTAQELLPSLTA